MYRINSIGKVWEIKPSRINGYLNCRISTSHREVNSLSGYVTDFSAYVNVRARLDELQVGDAIVFDDIAVSTSYNADKRVQYTNFYLERWHKYIKQKGEDNHD